MQIQLSLSPISQDEINNILWKACDTFRGTVDLSHHKNCRLVMLFEEIVNGVNEINVVPAHLKLLSYSYQGIL